MGVGLGALAGAVLGVRLVQTQRVLGLLSGALADLLLGRRLAAPHQRPLAAKAAGQTSAAIVCFTR